MIDIEFEQYIPRTVRHPVSAVLMTRGEYHEMNGWDIDPERKDDVGYFLKWEFDDNQIFTTWQPKQLFEVTHIPDTWEYRLNDETTELENKINKLNNFLAIEEDLPNEHLELMRKQYNAMIAYAEALNERRKILNLPLIQTN